MIYTPTNLQLQGVPPPNIFGGPTAKQGPNLFGNRQPVAAGSNTGGNLAGQYGLYNSAVTTQAKDYDDIMGNYKKLFKDVQGEDTPQMFMNGPYIPQTFNYNPTADYTSAIRNLQGLAKDGGYSDENLQDIRARSVSPIRAAYAGAMRDVDRQKSLQGGFSPNYAAVRAKMAREQSSILSDKMQDVEGMIADKVAQGRLSIAPTLASTTAAESALRNQYGARNTDIVNDASKSNIDEPLKFAEFNRNAKADKSGRALAALQGMTSLYGTTPALSSLFGSQAQNAARMAADTANTNNANKFNLFNTFMNRRPMYAGG